MKRLGITPRYSQAVIHNQTVYLSGQVPWETSRATSDIRVQTVEVLEYIDEQLALAGSDKSKILSLQIFMRDASEYEEMNEVFVKWIPDGAAPARNTICGVEFPNADWKIEMVVVAGV
jgi:enamine deaminase RidA (YjgF/YER057c/UK114 family)